MRETLEQFDYRVILFLRRYADEIARGALFIIYFWFGILKVFLISAAIPLVESLQSVTFLGPIPPDAFMVAFGLFEMVLGVMVLFPKLERITFALIGFHILTTLLPLVMLAGETWYAPFVPTLVGQYILKNAALLALGLTLFARMRPMTETHRILGEQDDDI